ncbi:MAG TPA: YafY family protein [Actinomycetota bacterium]|nr:YafY family protein [Actinomycetota bacterium]
MRADRLVAALLYLQSRGRVTAAELAAELEISERTARRDLEALAMAGIPVYSQQGRGGGWSLVGGARTDLSGLTAAEARTLFLVAGPSASATPQVKAALRKLVRALPEPFRAEAEAAASAVVLDPRTWDRPSVTPPPHLEVLQQAVVDGVQVRLRYAGVDRPESERMIHPLGLVSKASVWYLIAGTDAGMRTFRLSRVRSVTLTADPVDRPEGFDLEETWNQIVDTLGERRAGFRATARVVPDAVGWVRSAFGVRVTVGEPGEDGRVEVELRSWSADALAGELAEFGTAVEVIESTEARAALARLGEELLRTYGDPVVPPSTGRATPPGGRADVG